jgi:aryl-alcohol dehydrogenase
MTGVGIVEKVGAGVTRVKVGDSVVMSYASCGGCNNCQSGSPSYCSSHRLVNFGGSRLDGSKTHHSMVPGEVIHGSYFRQSAFATKV